MYRSIGGSRHHRVNRFNGPIWPAVGPDRNEDILKFKREALSPGFQERWDRAEGERLRRALGIDLLEPDIDELRRLLAENRRWFEEQRRRRNPTRTQGGIRLTDEDDE